MDGGAGADTMNGGAGDDTYFVNDTGHRVVEGAGTDTILSFLASYTLGAGVEDLRFGGSGSFIGIGIGIGNGLDNTIQGGAVVDRLFGGDGNDVLIGGGGADLLRGGAGSDTASYASASAGVDARLTGNSINFGGDALGGVYVGVENLTGSGFRDNLHGNDLANTLSGGSEGDNLFGNGGNDTLIGGGADNLLGHGGNDTFVFNAPGGGRDRIVEFSNVSGNDDRLAFEGDAFGGLAAGALAASRFVANTSGVATTASQRFVYETDTGLLRFDSNGSAAGGVTEVAVLTNLPGLTFDDFVIV